MSWCPVTVATALSGEHDQALLALLALAAGSQLLLVRAQVPVAVLLCSMVATSASRPVQVALRSCVL